MRRIIPFLLLLLAASAAHAQSTLSSGNVTDSGSQAWGEWDICVQSSCPVRSLSDRNVHVDGRRTEPVHFRLARRFGKLQRVDSVERRNHSGRFGVGVAGDAERDVRLCVYCAHDDRERNADAQRYSFSDCHSVDASTGSRDQRVYRC